MSIHEEQNPSLDWATIHEETARHLRTLLRFDTTNPPGNEHLAATYIRDQLVAEGIEPRIVEAAPGRASLWAKLPGKGGKRPLMLLSHLDVVPVERALWRVDPFGGEEHDGFIYGRGAVDMKQMTAMELSLFLHFARRARSGGPSLERDLILLAVADEERSGGYGMAWLVEHMPELLEAEFALNEGGGMGIDFGPQRIYLCEAAQKGSVHVTLRAHGKPGHAAIPHADNAIARLARALARLSAAPLPLHAIPTTQRFIAMIAATQSAPRRALLRQVLNPLLSEGVLGLLPDQDVANGLRAMLHNTASPTLLQAGTAPNVIPSEATAQLDVRIIPGQTVMSLEGELRRRIGDAQVAIEVAPHSPGYEMSTDTPLFAAITAAMKENEPMALVVPYLFPAVSDSRFLVTRGIIPYGFVPHRPEPGVPSVQSLAHGHDERISLANLQFGLHVLYTTITHLGR